MSESGLPATVTAVAVVDGAWWDDKNKFELIQRAARMFSSSPLVPDTYRGDAGLGSCVIALNMAHRMGADPLMVMQNLYIVHGRPAWSAQFLIACFNQTGRFSPLRYEWSGEENQASWGCTAWSTDRETGEKITGPLITIETAHKEGWFQKKGSKWQTIPRLMLMYRAAAWLVRTHAPELAMGLQTREEVQDTYDPSEQAKLPDNVLVVEPGQSRSEKAAAKLAPAEPAAPEPDKQEPKAEAPAKPAEMFPPEPAPQPAANQPYALWLPTSGADPAAYESRITGDILEAKNQDTLLLIQAAVKEAAETKFINAAQKKTLLSLIDDRALEV